MKTVSKKSRMNEAKFYAVRQALEIGKKAADTASFFDIHYTTVGRIKRFETWEAYQEYTREMSEQSRLKAEQAKKAIELEAELPSDETSSDIEASDEATSDEQVSTFVPSDEITTTVTKQDLLEMEARLNTKIHRQISGLRVYLSGPQKARLVSDITANVAKLFETSDATLED